MRTTKVFLVALVALLLTPSLYAGTLTVTVGDPTTLQKYYLVPFTVVASGSYTTNGDTLSLVSSKIGSAKLPVWVEIYGSAGFKYEFSVGTTLANGKMLTRGQQPTSATTGVIAFDQIAAAAYPGGVTGDTIKGLALIPR